MAIVLIIIALERFRDEELFVTQLELEKAGHQTVIASTVRGSCAGARGGTAIAVLRLAESAPGRVRRRRVRRWRGLQAALEQLRTSTRTIHQAHSQVRQHDWRGYLWLDFDLSGLPSSAEAEGGEKGYFGDKKTAQAANSPGSVPSIITRPSGRNSIPAAAIRFNVCSRQWRPAKLHLA